MPRLPWRPGSRLNNALSAVLLTVVVLAIVGVIGWMAMDIAVVHEVISDALHGKASWWWPVVVVGLVLGWWGLVFWAGWKHWI